VSSGTATGASRLVPLDDRRGWESALEGVPHSFAHTWDNCHAIAGSSGHVTYLYSYQWADATIVSPLSERPIAAYVDIVTPYGFSGFVGVGDCPSFAAEWWRFAERQGYVCGYLLLNPAMPNETYFGQAAGHHKILFVLDLRLAEEELFARLSTNRKRQVRRADAERDTLVTDREPLTEFFVQTYPDFIARRNAGSVYKLNEETLRELCESPQVFIVGAQQGGRIRAVSLFGYTRYAGDFLYNVSLPGYEPYSVMLIWSAVRELKARGVPSLNLGGGVEENDSLAEFKRRFGAKEISLRNMKQIYRRDIYDDLCVRAGVDSERSSYFPAYRSARSR
jgi:Acetyltransferase (GNAT) domain